jgi:roadblock/LC7 domain-containing protein
VNEFDKLVSRPGVLMAGRLGPDWRIAEHKSKGLLVENRPAMELTHWFFEAVTMMFQAMAFTTEGMKLGGSFNPTSMMPVRGWAFFGGDYTIVVRGHRFVLAETAKVDSLDELRRVLGEDGQE